MRMPVLPISALLGMICGQAAAQFTHPNCKNLEAKDFKMTELFGRKADAGAEVLDPTLQEPVQMDLHTMRKGDSSVTDIYFVERHGKVKVFDGATRIITTLGSIPVWAKKTDLDQYNDNGLMGLALHPDFARNRWLYLWYSPNERQGENRLLRLSRVTLRANHAPGLDSLKTLIEIKGSISDKFHSGGPMTFDSYGDLWVTVGNNSPDLDTAACSLGKNVLSRTDSTPSGEWGPSNTASLRGGIFRIHPDSSATGYSIPKGNFGDYWAQQWESKGNAALAAEYRNPAKVRPEVYVKGDRSNYSVAVHPTKRWLAWGVVNYEQTFDEFNLVTHPVFAGYPYFHADNKPTCNHGKDPAAPVNNSPFNSGVANLPPAEPGTLNNLVNVAMTGPIYVYDGGLAYKTKFPPHLHQSWITFSWVSGQMHIHTLDTVKVAVTKTQRVDNGLFAARKFRNPLQSKYGADGRLYVLNYDGSYNTVNPGVMRIDYVGDCSPLSVAKGKAQGAEPDIRLSSRILAVREAGAHRFTLYDWSGKARFAMAGSQGREYSLPGLQARFGLEKGVYIVRVVTAKGLFIRHLSLL